MELPQYQPRAFEASGLDIDSSVFRDRLGITAAELMDLVDDSSGTFRQLPLSLSSVE